MDLGARFPTKALIATMAALLATSGCGMSADSGETPVLNSIVADSIGVAPGGKPLQAGASGFGNYLAGRYAMKSRDFAAASDLLKRALDVDPTDTPLLRRTFVAKISDGDVDDAVAMARLIVDRDGNTPIARLALVVGAIKKGDFAAADAELAKFPDRGFNGFMKPLLQAWTLVGLNRGDEAVAALEPLKNQSGLRVLYELHAALVSDLIGRGDAAVGHYELARDNGRRATLRVVQGLGRHYEVVGDTEKARTLYQSYLGENPDSVVLQPALARLDKGVKPPLLVATPQEGIAEALFNIASTMTRENSAQLALIYGRLATHLRSQFDLADMLVAGLLESMDRHGDAAAVYAKIAPASPLFWSAQLRIAGNFEAMDRDEDAIALLRNLSVQFPDRPDPLVSLGDIFRSNKRYDESVDAYDRAFKVIGDIDQRHWTLLYSRGISLERSDRWPRAEQDFRKALELNPEQPYVLNYLGYSWVDKGINLQEARRMIERAVELRPDDGYIVDSLGWVLYRLRDFRGAVERLERAVELRPQDPTINDHLGDAYWHVGRRNEARFQWMRALALEPDPEQIPGIERKLREGLSADPAGRDS